jgi:arylsulfatase A-like enzyme
MTGLYPSAHGIHNNVLNGMAIERSLRPGTETFSEHLKDAGYELYYCGKWHVSATENPVDRGWEELAVSLGKLDVEPSFPAKQEENKSVPRSKDFGGEISRPGWRPYQLFTTEEYDISQHYDYPKIQLAKDKLRSLKDNEKPWCMYIGTGAPHDPFRGLRKYVDLYMKEDIKLPPNYKDEMLDKPAAYRRMRKVWDRLSEDEVKASIAHYWAYCTMVDDLFGEVLDTLEEMGQGDETLVVFMSDHGELLGAHGLYLKGIPHFDEGYRIPCIMRWPQGITEPGRSVDEFVSMMDFAPTFLELGQAAPISKSHGRSLVPFLNNETVEDWPQELYTQCNGVEIYYTQRVVLERKYKFVYNATDTDELYDLELDPFEMVNIIDREDVQHIKHRMYAKMWRLARKSGDPIFNQYPSSAPGEIGPDYSYPV